jgi:hypothetical protein
VDTSETYRMTDTLLQTNDPPGRGAGASTASAVSPNGTAGAQVLETSALSEPVDIAVVTEPLSRDCHGVEPSGVTGPEAERDTRGRFQRHNTAAVTHGARSAAFWRAAQAQVDAIAGSIIRDAGHSDDDAPEALRLAAFATARAALTESGTWLRMVETGGPGTSSERTRATFTRWSAAAGNTRDWLRLIGLRRVPKPAPDPLVALRERVARDHAAAEVARAARAQAAEGETT